MISALPTGAGVAEAPGGGRAVTAAHRALPGDRGEPGTLAGFFAGYNSRLVSPSLMRMKADSPGSPPGAGRGDPCLPPADEQGSRRGPGATAASETAGQEHEVRVFPGFHDGSENITLRCRCGEAWNLEPGHTTAELNILALEHRGGRS